MNGFTHEKMVIRNPFLNMYLIRSKILLESVDACLIIFDQRLFSFPFKPNTLYILRLDI